MPRPYATCPGRVWWHASQRFLLQTLLHLRPRAAQRFPTPICTASAPTETPNCCLPWELTPTLHCNFQKSANSLMLPTARVYMEQQQSVLLNHIYIYMCVCETYNNKMLFLSIWSLNGVVRYYGVLIGMHATVACSNLLQVWSIYLLCNSIQISYKYF